MTEVLLFHHVLGLTPGVRAFAETLRAAGHTVHTPDLFDGHTFDSIDEGMAHVRSLGFGTVIEAGARAAEPLPADSLWSFLANRERARDTSQPPAGGQKPIDRALDMP